MAGGKTIKGITVEIGGDTTKLGKALDGVTRTSRNLQGELKQVNNLLKLDPGNTDLLAQKQKILADSIEATKDKLDILREAQSQIEQQYAAGTIDRGAYLDFQRELVNTEQRLDDLKEKQKEFGSVAKQVMQEAAGKVNEFGEKMSGAGQSLLPATAAVTGFAALSVKAMDDVDAGLDVVMQKTGATGEEAAALGDVFNEVATSIPGEFADAGAAVGEVNTRLGFTGDALRDASEAFLKYAKVNGTDVNTSVQLVTRAMGDAGIAAEDYGSVLDSLTVAGQKSGISVDTLATNLAKYGAPMRQLGLDTQQSIALFAGWEKAGVNTEIAFSGMKKAISNWAAEGKDASVEFQNVLDKIAAAPDLATASTMAIEVFGAKAGPDLADAIQGGRFAVDEYVEALKNSEGAVQGTYDMIVDEVDDTARAQQTLKVALHDVGETIAKTAGPWLLKLAQYVKNVMDKFNQDLRKSNHRKAMENRRHAGGCRCSGRAAVLWCWSGLLRRTGCKFQRGMDWHCAHGRFCQSRRELCIRSCEEAASAGRGKSKQYVRKAPRELPGRFPYCLGSPYSRTIASKVISHCLPNFCTSIPSRSFPYDMALRRVLSLRPHNAVASPNARRLSKGVDTGRLL